MKPQKFEAGNYSFSISGRTHVMGILNITPDSFSDGGIFFSLDKAVLHGEKMAQEGADIIDIGGESTRPFSEEISLEEEIRRVVPVIELLAKKINIPISIDTTKAIVAKHAIEAGASIINDISALRFDPEMGQIACKYNVPIILMHMKGQPKNMQVSPTYENLIGEIKLFFKTTLDKAKKYGIDKSKIIIDPGIGFGKTAEHNLILIQNLSEFKTFDVPILIGPSRKWFIRHILREKDGKDLEPNLPIVGTGTQAAIAAAILNGADMVRVHDVSQTVATVKIIDAIKKTEKY